MKKDSMNNIDNRTVRSLLGLRFFIPSYQRGYRWTEQQVNDLLNDILEFSNKKSNNSEFYCLQPLVVKKKDEGILENIKKANSIEEVEKLLKGTWELIDGQQRLTTLFIILYVLNNGVGEYSIEYETRKGFSDFLKKLQPLVAYDNDLVNGLKTEWDNVKGDNDNIDFYHIFIAYHTIKRFLADTSRRDSIKEGIYDYVRFIWYETTEDNPIKVFTRLNIGRIPLTNAELIKALILNSSNFGNENANYIRLIQQEIALEWDNIEYCLQNDEFWLFLNHIGYEKPTRIDFIFDMIVGQNKLNLSSEELSNIGKDEYRTFRYFFAFFSKNKSKEGIKECWSEIKKYFQTFEEWFNDLEMYHYVGYLVEQNVKLSEIYKKWTGDKTKFIEGLKEEIKKKIVNCNDLDKQYELNGCPQKTTCKPLLLLHNIKTVINQNNRIKSEEKYALPIFYKFPFHLFKSESWDVEHIDSNTTNALDKEKDQIEWLKCSLLDNVVSQDSGIRTKIHKFINNDKDKISFNTLVEAIEESQEDRKDKRLSDEDKNKVWNFVLLDAGTNRGYGNAIFPAKRRTIIGKDQGKNIYVEDNLEVSEEKGAIAFVPPVTKNVFLKYYNASVDDLRAWTISDAEAYKTNIHSVLKEFGVELNNNNNND